MGDPEADAENEILKIEQDRQVFVLCLFLSMFFFDLPGFVLVINRMAANCSIRFILI